MKSLGYMLLRILALPFIGCHLAFAGFTHAVVWAFDPEYTSAKWREFHEGVNAGWLDGFLRQKSRNIIGELNIRINEQRPLRQALSEAQECQCNSCVKCMRPPLCEPLKMRSTPPCPPPTRTETYHSPFFAPRRCKCDLCEIRRYWSNYYK